MATIIREVITNFWIGQSASVNNLTTLPIYGSIEKADNYFSMLLHGMRWSDTDRTRKLQALVSATKRIDLLNFTGYKAYESQPLQFPRGRDTEIPVAIEEATYELALVLLKGINPDTERDNLYKQTQVYGPVRTDYKSGSVPLYIVHGIPSPTAWNLLYAYLQPRLGLQLCRVD
jgi:hypothetical protein